MASVSITRLYEILSNKLGREPAESLTTFIEEKIRDEFQDRSNVFATKEDVASSKSDLIKWMFIFWVGQVAATFGFILLFLKK